MKKVVKKVKAKPMAHKPKGEASGKVKTATKPTGIPRFRKGYAK
jgi:hypothetical protein